MKTLAPNIKFALCLWVGWSVLFASLVTGEEEEKEKPHIILIVADDLGFNDVPWHNKEVMAPNLLNLAQQGIILERSYVQPICSPTRSAILTGTYPYAIGRQSGVIWPLMPTGLTLEKQIIPQLLKPHGYSTHAVGKWHLGFCKWAYTPTERGFDTFKGFYTGSEDYYDHHRNYQLKNESCEETQTEFEGSGDEFKVTSSGYDFRTNRKPDFSAKGIYSSYLFASRVEEILRSSSSKIPKFVYMAFQSVHSPLQVPDNYTKPYRHIKDKDRRTYLGMVTALDEAVGRIITALKDTGHYSNSVIVFTTDNGGPTISGGNNWPLRGNKTTLWEGGTRGAAFVHSTLLPRNGTVSRNLIHTTDWLATFVGLAGASPPKSVVDSVDQWPALKGASSAPRKELVYNINFRKGKGIQAGIRVGNYKLLLGDPGKGDWTPPPEMKEKQPKAHVRNTNTFHKVAKSWTFDDHMNFIKKAKSNCKTLACLQRVVRKYKTLKHSTNNVPLWKKVLKVIKGYVSSFRRWVREGKHSSKTKRSLTVKESKPTTSSEPLDSPSGNWSSDVMDMFSTGITPEFESFLRMMSPDTEIRLYNLRDDPEERMNLAKKAPGVVIELTKKLLSYGRRWVNPDTPKNDPKGDPDHYGGVWSPGWC